VIAMPPSNKQVEIDARWVYWRSFLLFFLVNQLMTWHRVSLLPIRMPGHRMIVFLLAPWATPQSFAVALVAAGILSLLAIVIVRLIVRPLWNFWLNPPVDPAWGLFHLSASEAIVSSLPARRRLGWSWQPGLLALTDRRLWFFPSAWDGEPWSLNLDEADHIEREDSFVAELAPIRNWPVPFHLLGRSGQDAVFAVADPDAILAWFRPPAGHDSRRLAGSGGSPQAGAVDV
jgi:hypothetical protein